MERRTDGQYRVLREPKGGADAVVVGYEDEIPTLTRAANILSVQGFVCRIVLLNDGAERKSLPAALLPEDVPSGGMRAFGEAADIAAEELAAKLRKEILIHAGL